MEIITYLAVGVFSSAITHHFAKKRNNRVVIELKNNFEFFNKKQLDELSKKNNLIAYQKEILYWISDGIHNIGNENYQKNFEYDKKEFSKKIGSFFSITRVLTENIKNEIYTENELTDILNFIKDDFGNYCHYMSKDLDLDKYTILIVKGR